MVPNPNNTTALPLGLFSLETAVVALENDLVQGPTPSLIGDQPKYFRFPSFPSFRGSFGV